MDPADNARRSTIIREGRRALARTAQLRTALAAPELQPYLAEVDRRWPGLVDGERVRVARILAGRAGQGRAVQILGAA